MVPLYTCYGYTEEEELRIREGAEEQEVAPCSYSLLRCAREPPTECSVVVGRRWRWRGAGSAGVAPVSPPSSTTPWMLL